MSQRAPKLLALCIVLLAVQGRIGGKALAQGGGAGTVHVEPYVGALWGALADDVDEYRAGPVVGIRLSRLYDFDRGVFIEGWLARRQGSLGYCCRAEQTVAYAALLAGVSSTLIDRNATGWYGLNVLAGLGLLRLDIDAETDRPEDPYVFYGTVQDSWNLAFSGSFVNELELTRQVRLQIELGFLLLYVLGSGRHAKNLSFERLWVPQFRVAVGLVISL